MQIRLSVWLLMILSLLLWSCLTGTGLSGCFPKSWLERSEGRELRIKGSSVCLPETPLSAVLTLKILEGARKDEGSECIASFVLPVLLSGHTHFLCATNKLSTCVECLGNAALFSFPQPLFLQLFCWRSFSYSQAGIHKWDLPVADIT